MLLTSVSRDSLICHFRAPFFRHQRSTKCALCRFGALIISPQTNTFGNPAINPTAIAPNYVYDSTLITNPGAAAGGTAQGTRHLLPPLLKISMVALDQMAGEQLSFSDTLRQEVIGKVGSLFTGASNLTQDLEGTPEEPGELKTLLLQKKLNFRIFTTTIALKQARWSL